MPDMTIIHHQPRMSTFVKRRRKHGYEVANCLVIMGEYAAAPTLYHHNINTLAINQY